MKSYRTVQKNNIPDPFVMNIEFRTQSFSVLDQIEELFHEYKSKQNPVLGVIIEPIQSEGGDYHGSPTFFQRLQKLTKQVNKFHLMQMQ